MRPPLQSTPSSAPSVRFRSWSIKLNLFRQQRQLRERPPVLVSELGLVGKYWLGELKHYGTDLAGTQTFRRQILNQNNSVLNFKLRHDTPLI